MILFFRLESNSTSAAGGGEREDLFLGALPPQNPFEAFPLPRRAAGAKASSE